MEKYGICLLAAMPLYAEASQRSEMISQLLWGDSYQVEKSTADNKWLYISMHFDNYEGWIDATQFYPVDMEWIEMYVHQTPQYLTTAPTLVKHKEVTFMIPAGSYLPAFQPQDSSMDIPHRGQVFLLSTDYKKITTENPIFILKIALTFQNIPYLWGGKTCMGMDCSGFTQIVYKIAGYRLWRDAKQQVTQGTEIAFADRKTGDLAFFQRDGRVVHVGIVLPDNQIIHALSNIRIDLLDETGIYHSTQKSYTHYNHSLRRIILE